MKTSLLIMILALSIMFGFMIGLCAGIETGERKAFEKLGIMFEGSIINIEVDINETLLVDRTTENMKEIMWDLRMENCTRTEKGYCALECYENNKLIPCENFSSDEHFCNEGVCEVSGICPDYYEELEGKTISDCIYELEGGKQNE